MAKGKTISVEVRQFIETHLDEIVSFELQEELDKFIRRLVKEHGDE